MCRKAILILTFWLTLLSSTAFAEQFVPIADNVGAWKFLSNWGYESSWNKNNLISESPPGTISYLAFIPAASSGLADLGQNRAGLGVAEIIVFPNSGEVCGIRLLFNGNSPNPRKTMSDAFTAIIGKRNFDIDKSKFDEAFSQVIRQGNFAYYYSENMGRTYMIATQRMNDNTNFYKMVITALR